MESPVVQAVALMDKQERRQEERLGAGVTGDKRPGVLVLGSGPLAETIISHLQNGHRARYRFAGCLDSTGSRQNNGVIVEGFARLREIAERSDIDYIVVALSERRGALPIEDLLTCKASGIRVEEGVAFFEKISGRVSIVGLTPSSLIFTEGFRRSRLAMLCKRVVDIGISAAALLVCLPVLAIIAIALKLDSSGPVFFVQDRVGERGKLFRLIKFRSMRCEQETEQDERWAREKDPRITRVGRFIRQWRLDEWPQLWNVLTGVLSLVGPRPDVPLLRDTLQSVIPFYGLRTAIKPGLTGWAQVRYQYVSSFQEGLIRHEYDLYYLKNLSLALDLKIILETVKVLVLGKGSR